MLEPASNTDEFRVMGDVLRSVLETEAPSRASIARLTGLGRSTVASAVEGLLGRGLITEQEPDTLGRGRPPRVLLPTPRTGQLAVVDLDVSGALVAVASRSGEERGRAQLDMGASQEPKLVLRSVADAIQSLAGSDSPVCQVVVGMPAAVDMYRGCPIRPHGMPGWDGFPVAAYLGSLIGADATVDNDVNLMALGEVFWQGAVAPLVFVKAGYGVGAGLVSATGKLLRGADGAAGDIGHIRTWPPRNARCTCGKVDCLEAVASYRAISEDLGVPYEEGESYLHPSRRMEQLVASMDTTAVQRLRQAASDIGEVITSMVLFLNPRSVILGGSVSELHDVLLSGVRAAVYEGAMPLSTTNIVIAPTRAGSDAELRGAIALAMQLAGTDESLARLFLPAGAGAN